ncbi:MAG: hypothetical protein WBW04_02660 [Nitrolancea sp.]
MFALQLDAILMIALIVVTAGLAISRLFDRLDRSVLFTFTGGRSRLLVLRIAVFSLATLSSIGVCGILFLTLPSFVALAIFFAFEAIVLDICTQRVEFVREMEPVLARSAARTPPQGTMTGAY